MTGAGRCLFEVFITASIGITVYPGDASGPDAQLQFLRIRECDEIQGYLFSRPLGSSDATAFLRERQRTISP